MADGALDNFDLEGRLAAHRQIISWMLTRAVRSPNDLADLKAHIDEAIPPRDHQEDPGAVPTMGHAEQTAAGIETRLLLESLEREINRRGTEEAYG